ncbi:phage tail tube protein [Sphingobium limneticum]
MATKINSADPFYFFVEELVPGVTPATGPRYELPVPTDQAPPVYSTAEIASNTKRPNRSSNGSQQGMGSVEWSLTTRLQKSPVFDALLKAGLGGEWVNNKLAASDKDSSFSILTTLKKDTAVSPAEPNGLFYVDAGLTINSLELSATAGEGVNVTFGMLGLSRTTSEAEHGTTPTALAATAREFKYDDLKNVKLTGPNGVVDLGVSSLTLTIAHEKEIRAICGQKEGVDIGTSGARATAGTITLYRESFEINSDVTGEPQKLSFEFTRAGVGYRATVPGAIFQKPTDELSGSSVMVSLTYTGRHDDDAGTDVFIERL